MKRLMLGIIAPASLSGNALFAQSLVGTWQGTLIVPQAPKGEPRVVYKISTTDVDSLKAVMYSIDQGGQPISASTVTLQGGTVKIQIPGIGGTYEGKLSADGNSITGDWTQGPMPLTLNLARTTNQTAWTIPEPPARPKPMARGRQAPPPADNAEGPPDLYTAIQQQLGLKLESRKAPVEVLVIDPVEKPSEN